MRQVALRARLLPQVAGVTAALFAVLALLALSGQAQGLGESIETAPAHVWEGEPFHANVTVASLTEPASVQVKVTCPSCGSGWTTPPLSKWRQSAPSQWKATVDFPGPLFGGAQQQPLWAQNYTVSIAGTGASSNVTVHLHDGWLKPQGYLATEAVQFRVAGVPPGQTASIAISKWARNGATVSVANLSVLGLSGVAQYDWRIPKEHAADMTCPAWGKCRNYTAVVTVGSRLERVQWSALPAQLDVDVAYLLGAGHEREDLLLPVGQGLLSFNRTETITLAVDVKYLNGARMGQSDRSVPGNATLNGTLKVQLERVTVATTPDGAQTVTGIDKIQTLWLRYTSKGWRGTWTVPWNLTASAEGAENPQYRLRVPGQEDRWGNVIPDTNATSFRVKPLHITPVLVGIPAQQVERLTNASAVLNIRYEDGTPWVNGTNTSAMAAWLVDEDGEELRKVPLRYLRNGTWVVSFQPALRFEPLGYFKLRLQDSTDDAGNQVLETDTEFFEVVPARPRVEFVTRVGGEARNETQGFARGEQVRVHATIRYADGAPFNASRLPEGKEELELNITKVDASGGEHGYELLALRPTDDEGHWSTLYPIEALDQENPLGPWRWNIAVEDGEEPANVNLTTFTRWVRGAGIEVELRKPPEPIVRAGGEVTLRFSTQYPGGKGRVGEEQAAGGLAVLVHPWKEGEALAPVARLVTVWLEERGEWAAVWHTNRTTLVGDYVLSVQGQDLFGNLVAPFQTRAITVFVDQLQRQVLRDPPEQVLRGDTAIVVFDGMEGDFGEPGEAAPRIELQKWNPLRQAWEKERHDLRDAPVEGFDHVGRLPTDQATNLGTYRFAFFGRNDQHAAVNATSRAFKVMPVELERPWMQGALDATQQPVIKGAQLTLPLERREGDLLQGVSVYRAGERVANATVLLKPGRFDVTWRTNHVLTDGAYLVIAKGRDLHNNTFVTPPLNVTLVGVALQAKVPAAPQAALQRAERVDLRALVQYPDAVAVKTGAFTASFVLGNETVGQRDLVLNRSAWLLNWTPPASAPLGRYSVVLDGDDGLGNKLEAREVWSFTLGEGVLKRSFSFQKAILNRTETATWLMAADEGDADMRFVLKDETGSRKELPFTVKAGDYFIQWQPDKAERLGRYTLEVQGTDGAGNALLGESKTMLLRAAQLRVVFVDRPGRTVQPDETVRWEFQILYADGTPLPASAENPPSVAILEGNDVVSKSRPDLTIGENGRWVATWKPTSKSFKLAVGGQTLDKNEIKATASESTRVDQGFVSDILKTVPGFETALVPLVLLGAALLVRRGRRGA